jgi:hypothetical protein
MFSLKYQLDKWVVYMKKIVFCQGGGFCWTVWLKRGVKLSNKGVLLDNFGEESFRPKELIFESTKYRKKYTTC